ncbi:arginyltransferase [Colwellia sp. MEBiC06753]
MEQFKLGISKEFPCNYLPDKNERLIIVIDDLTKQTDDYDYLMHQGFRRSGDQVYRPHCRTCNQCQSIRVCTDLFKPTKSQKRLLKKNQQFSTCVTEHAKPEYYSLFETYINTLHSDGAMYPASEEQYNNFIFTDIAKQLFLEIYDENKLISVAVTDVLPNAISAIYTFYHPAYRKQALGIYSILQQIALAKTMKKPFVYLGYQIDECQKMNYKAKFFPHHRLINNQWQIVNK